MAPTSSKQIKIRKDVRMGGLLRTKIGRKKETTVRVKLGKGVRAEESRWKYEDPNTQHISELREEMVGCLRDCEVQVLIVVADSYSQRSLFLPRYIAEALGPGTKAACAYFSSHAAAMAARFSRPELGIPTSVTEVRRNRATLEFMSAQTLLQAMVVDRDLSSFSAVYVDAAHSRTLTTDILLGSLLPLLVRPSFRLVLGVAPSAVHEADKLSAFFGRHCSTKACVLPNMPPPPPLISYLDPQGDPDGRFGLSVILELHRSEETLGSILVFLSRRSSVDGACRWFQRRIAESSNPKDKTLHVIPLHTGDDWELHATQLPPPPGRCLFILSPEVPDAWPQLHGVSYVIDPGETQQRRGGRVSTTSQQSANERAALLRSADPPPKCLRLYPESLYRDKMPRTTTPEILSYNAQELSVALGTMKLLGVTDPWTFNFIDPPSPKTLSYAVELMAPLPDLSLLSL